MNILDEAYELTDEEGNTFQKDTAALKKYFNIFNDKYFEGKLGPIDLVWFNAKNIHGYFLPHPVIKEKRIQGVKIGLNINACGTFAAFRNTFVHEMLHYYVDVYIGLPESNWEAVKRYADAGMRDKARIALRNTPETAHGYEWAKLARELSEKYPELGNIETYAVSNAETGVALYDKMFVINWCKKNILLRHKNNGIVRVCCVSANNKEWEDLQKYLEKGEGPARFAGTWERLWPTLDNKNFVLIKTTKSLNHGYDPHYFEEGGKGAKLIRKVQELGTVIGNSESTIEDRESIVEADSDKHNYYLINYKKIIKVVKYSDADRQMEMYRLTGEGTFALNDVVQKCYKNFDIRTWKKLQVNRNLNSGYYDINDSSIAAMFKYCEWGPEEEIKKP